MSTYEMWMDISLSKSRCLRYRSRILICYDSANITLFIVLPGSKELTKVCPYFILSLQAEIQIKNPSEWNPYRPYPIHKVNVILLHIKSFCSNSWNGRRPIRHFAVSPLCCGLWISNNPLQVPVPHLCKSPVISYTNRGGITRYTWNNRGIRSGHPHFSYGNC